MSATARIRRARSTDLLAILELERLFPGDRMSRRSLRAFLASPRTAIWVAELNASLVGALVLLTRRNSRYARIYSVVVAPAARGRGLARRLIGGAEREARRRGCVGMSLEVRADNHAARALYAQLGYRETLALSGYYEDGAPGLRLQRHFGG